MINSREIQKANAVTHGGVFHADDVFSTVFLSKLIPELKVCRTFKVPEDLPKGVLVYDIGGGAFDHHMKDFSLCRENGIKFSSFGLLWKSYGMEWLENINVPNAEMVWDMFDRTFVSSIDAVDNGQVIKHSEDKVNVMSVSAVISSFNPNWDEDVDADKKFSEAVAFADTIFSNVLNNAISKAKAKTAVETAIVKSAGGIMTLEMFMPWQDYVLSSYNTKAKEILYVVFPSNRGGYNVQAVPESLGSFTQRKPLPEAWAGLNEEALAKASGVEDATFCHVGRFLCSAKTLCGALEMAKKATKI
jgi:uncharacterized UPF0160 family protein